MLLSSDVRDVLLTLSEVIGVDISPHMKQDDTPENFWPEVRYGVKFMMRLAEIDPPVSAIKTKDQNTFLWINVKL